MMNESSIAPIAPVYHTAPRLTRDKQVQQPHRPLLTDDDDDAQQDDTNLHYFSLDNNVGTLLNVSAHRLTRKNDR